MAMIPSSLSPQGRCDSRTHVWDLIEYHFFLIIVNVQKAILTLTIQDINSVAVFLKLCKNFTLLISGVLDFLYFQICDTRYCYLKERFCQQYTFGFFIFNMLGWMQNYKMNIQGGLSFSCQNSLWKFPELEKFVGKNIPFYFKVSHILIVSFQALTIDLHQAQSAT